MVTLESDRLILRMFRESDLNEYAEMCADPEVMRYISTGVTLSRPAAWQNMAFVIGHWHLRGYGLWAVEEQRSGILIGRIGCWKPEGWPGFEVGWMLRRQSWGHGFATEGARMALKYAFDTLQLDHVISLIHPRNEPSIRVSQRLGEKLEGTTYMATVPGVLLNVYGISREAWVATQAPH